MARKWVKLWCKNDVDNLSLEETGAWYHLLRMAGFSPEEGYVCINSAIGYPIPLLAQMLKTTPYRAKNILQKFTELDRIEILPNGVLKLNNWHKYQSEYSRTKDAPSRKSTRKSTPKSTPLEVEVEVDIDNRSRSRSRGSPNPTPITSAAYDKYLQAHSGHLNQIQSEQIGELIDIFGDQWVADAIVEAVRTGVSRPPPKYLETMLNRWKKEGLDPPEPKRREVEQI